MASNIIQYDLTAIGGELAYTYILLLNTLFISVQFLADTEIYPPDKTDRLLQENLPEFDFIIVGAGMSGCLMANRLVQNHNWTVLLIEAGGYPPTTSEVPALYQSLIHSEYDWSFRLEPEASACQSMSCCKLSSGKVLGGTSAINNMHFTRGLPSDFDTWGCPNWDSRVVLKAFENIERFAGKSKQMRYGFAGDVPLTNLEHSESSIRKLLSDTYIKLGYEKIGKGEYLGHKDELMTIKEGRRQNGAKTFLSSIKNWQNFYLLINAHVNKVLTNHPIDLRTSGVEVQLANKQVRNIRVRKDVILAGGAINTPKLLMLSGIGPKEELEKHGIKTIVDVPQIGKNLQIHISVPIFYGFPCCFDCIKNCHINLGKRVQSFAEYIMKSTGDYVKTRLNDFVTYINTKRVPYPYPNIAIYHQYFRPNETTLEKHVRKDMGYNEHTRKILQLLNKDQVILEFDVTLLKPKSIGNVTLRSNNPFDSPVIHGNFFSDPTFHDRDTILSGLNHVINMMDTEEVQDLRANLVHIDIPNCRNYKYLSDRYLNCYVRNMAFPLGDQSGTVAMGPPCETSRPLTDTLEMRRVRGLRVIGSSVMPIIVSTRAEGSKAVMAEIASQFIRQKWTPDYPNMYQINNECDEEVDDDPDE